MTRHLGLVQTVARRFANRGEPVDDLRQVGYIGLLKAAGRFDRKRGVAFTTYGYAKIIGEIRRYFRDKCWTIRVPRKMQESVGELSSAYRPLSLDATFNNDAGAFTFLEIVGSVDPDIERAEIHGDMVAACSTLSERERSIVRLRFFEELTQTAIGTILGKSQMYVSRVEKQALHKLRGDHSEAIAAERALNWVAI